MLAKFTIMSCFTETLNAFLLSLEYIHSHVSAFLKTQLSYGKCEER